MQQIASVFRRFTEEIPSLPTKSEVPMSAYTSLRIGGPAELMVFPQDEQQLTDVLRIANESEVKPLIIGSGSNLLVPDEGLRALLVMTKDGLTDLTLLSPTRILAQCGVSMTRLASFARDNSLSGLEFAHGIPGTVGGGVFMNAGAYGGEIAQVAAVTNFMLPDGSVTEYVGREQSFSYRNSAFQTMQGLILNTEFELTPADKEAIAARMKELSEKRRSSQPLELPSAGSAFKRPESGFAAAMIAEAGLKGARVGGAAVSEKHAGFIVNLGGASACDVLELIELIKARVFAAFGVELEPEIRILQ
ncbi:MAG: UDP-N-acetylmuramate dehydrogenase [Oscillospiraceae bacterium]|jgi:UDP-N-acetylmuramate dehydrogenase|nr:UDP-N-acetylmuramate dehydrogenase [Oscillospiraceae bacterium]